MDFAIRTILVGLPLVVLNIAIWVLLIYLLILAIKALRKYIRGGDNRPETVAVRKSLGEAIKTHRTRCNMTQELVAERVGVSRQAVSKWESGVSDPSTSNLLALCRLFGISVEELLKEVE